MLSEILLAGGDYPDAVLFENINNLTFLDALKNDLIVPITPYLDKYGKNIVNYSYPISLDCLKINNTKDIYGIPRTSILRTDGSAIRKVWADNLDLKLPKESGTISLDDFTKLLHAFSKDDPDGNKKNDTYGLRNFAANGGILSVNALEQLAFDLIGWQEIDGKYVDLQYSKDHDNYKRALTYMNMLWEEGLVDPDWPSLTQAVADQRRDAGMYGISGAFPGHVTTWEANMKKVDPNAELLWIAGIANKDGKVVGGGYNNSPGLWGFTSIMSTAKHPERIVEMYDYMLSDELWTETVYGLEGVIWETNKDKEKVLLDPAQNGSTGWFRNIVRRHNAPEFFVGLDVLPKNRSKVLTNLQTAMNNYVFTLDSGFVAPITTDLAYIDYQTELNKVVTKIIVGDLPVSAWDAALEGFYKAGYDKFAEQTVNYIKSKKAK